MIEIPLSIRSIYSKVSYTSKPFRNVSTVMETIIKPPLFSSISCSCLGAIFHGFLDNNHNHVSSYTNSCDIVLYCTKWAWRPKLWWPGSWNTGYVFIFSSTAGKYVLLPPQTVHTCCYSTVRALAWSQNYKQCWGASRNISFKERK